MSTLRLNIDPTGAVTGGAKAETALEEVARQAFQTEAATQRVGAGFRGVAGASGALNTATTGTRRMGLAVQNASYQVGDFAVQVAAGTSATRALSMQLPQLLGGFGIMGAVAGAAVAIIGALVPVFFGASEGASSLSETVDDLAESMDALRRINRESNASFSDMQGKFGAQAAQAREILAIERQLAAVRATRAFQAASTSAADAFAIGNASNSAALAENLRLTDELIAKRDELARQNAETVTQTAVGIQRGSAAIEEQIQLIDVQIASMGGLHDAIARAAQEFNVTETDMRRLALAAADVAGALNVEDQVAAATALAAAIEDVTAGFAVGSDEAFDIYQGLLDAVTAGLELEGLDLASGIGAAADEAGRLAQNLSNAQFQQMLYYQQYAETRGAAPDRPVVHPGVAGGGGGQSATEKMADQYSRLRSSLDATYRATQDYNDAQELLNRALDAGQISQAEFNETLALAKARLDEATTAASGLDGVFDTVQQSMTDAFMSMVDGTMSAKDAFRSMARDIIAELYRVLVVQQLVGQVGTATSTGSGIMGFLGGLFGRASGGPVTSGQPYMVGERGPEMFVPSGNGRIEQPGGAVTVHQTINLTTGVQATVRAELMQWGPRLAEQSVSAVLAARKRGGAFSAAFS